MPGRGVVVVPRLGVLAVVLAAVVVAVVILVVVVVGGGGVVGDLRLVRVA